MFKYLLCVGGKKKKKVSSTPKSLRDFHFNTIIWIKTVHQLYLFGFQDETLKCSEGNIILNCVTFFMLLLRG